MLTNQQVECSDSHADTYNIRSIRISFNFDAQCLPKVDTTDYMYGHYTPWVVVTA
ncbi:hypothetical protein M378DRAFT_170831 [Amanita muscaria Koide BX008]|uniref:Uncharacterized protein n=1 Tax=Amanita muscaria (strain Koide BX008) TaxID=946122 RepID=A0A0C2WPQ7_AMAMK|nr:hypothetical protein M378DRAFT_170831 [Amanita muscaria Koide BX008]